LAVVIRPAVSLRPAGYSIYLRKTSLHTHQPKHSYGVQRAANLSLYVAVYTRGHIGFVHVHQQYDDNIDSTVGHVCKYMLDLIRLVRGSDMQGLVLYFDSALHAA